MGISTLEPLSNAKRVPAQTQNVKGKVKIKFSLCLIKLTQRYEDVMGSRVMGPPFLTSELDEVCSHLYAATDLLQGKSPPVPKE
jgi:hypothetical protein